MPDLLERLKNALADRYRVEREIGRGGMAHVFLAQDLKLDRPVALKVLRPDLAAALGSERFLQEITLSAKLDHPHILPLLDSGETDGTLFYTMPFVEGESLRDRLAREGQLSLEEALQLTREVADALSHAHSRGIIHRDIKPENILLAGGHARVVDFGIAKAVSEAGGENLTETGVSIGTPAYMSPEQATGSKDLDARTDVYALGCVLYEMLSGDPPFVGSTPQAVLARKSVDTPQPIRSVRDAVPETMEHALLKSLARVPADRYRTPHEFMAALATQAKEAEQSRRSRWALAGLVAATIVIAGLGGWWFLRPTATALDRNLVAVVPPENRTGDASLDYLSGLAAERMVGYAQSEQVAGFVPLDAVRASLAEAADRDLLSAVTARTGAGLVVTGSYFLLGDTLSFQAQVIDGETGQQTNVVMPVSGRRDAIATALHRLAERVAVRLFVEINGSWLRSTSFQWGDPTLQALRLCQEGLTLNHEKRYAEALERFQAAWAIDTSWVVPLFMATGPLFNSGGGHAAADSLTRVVYRKRDQLSESARLSAQSSIAMYDGDWEAATQYRCQAFEAEPARSTIGARNCSYFAVRANRPTRALWAWEESAHRQGVPPLELDDEVHLLFAVHAYHLLGDYERELAVARRFLQRAAPNDIPGAEYAELQALVGLGQLEEVQRGIEAMATMAVSDTLAVSRMRGLGLELRYHGYPDDGTWALQRAAGLFGRGLVADATGVLARFNHATVLYHLEDWDAAWRELRALEALAQAEEVQDEREIWIMGYLGLTAARLGDPVSVAEYEDWLRERDRTGRYMFGLAKSYLARIAAVQRRREEAVGTLRQAFREGLPQWPRWDAELQWRFDFEGLADYEPYQDLIRPRG